MVDPGSETRKNDPVRAHLGCESDSTREARRSTRKNETGSITEDVLAICVCAWQLPTTTRIPEAAAAFTIDVAAAISIDV